VGPRAGLDTEVREKMLSLLPGIEPLSSGTHCTEGLVGPRAGLDTEDRGEMLSVRTSKRTSNFAITKINWLMLFKEIIAVYSENHAKPNTKCSITDCQSTWFI
jgi:hypothetical protein